MQRDQITTEPEESARIAGLRYVSAKKNVVAVIEKVAAEPGNTPAVCRKCYVHPAVLETYLEGVALSGSKRIRTAGVAALHAEERMLLRLLEQRPSASKAT